MKSCVRRLTLLAFLVCQSAQAVQDPAVSLQNLKLKEQQIVKQLESITYRLKFRSISSEECNRLQGEHIKAQKELSATRQSIQVSQMVSGNELVDYAKD
jgi:hypothetical protein